MGTAVTVTLIIAAAILSLVFIPAARSAALFLCAKTVCTRYDAHILNDITKSFMAHCGNSKQPAGTANSYVVIASNVKNMDEGVELAFHHHPDFPDMFSWTLGIGWNLIKLSGGLSFCITNLTASRNLHGNPHLDLAVYTPIWGGKKKLTELVGSIFNEMRPEPLSSERIHVFSSEEGEWSFQGQIQKREPGTVVLPGTMMEEIIDDIRRFRNEKEWYEGMGIPYSRGYLLTGPPGNGKSTIIRSVATALKSDVRYLDLSSDGASGDSQLRALVNAVDDEDILVLEDVDCFFNKRRPANGVTVTFTGLLNVLDGLQAPSGRIIFVTTNDRGALDPALVRPGRLDVDINVDDPTRDQIRNMHLRFFPEEGKEAEDFATKFSGKGICMAEIEGKLICRALGNRAISWSTSGFRVEDLESVDSLDGGNSSDSCESYPPKSLKGLR